VKNETVSIEHSELVDALITNIDQAGGLVDEINERVINCATLLRVEQSENAFRQVSTEIKNLTSVMEFINEVKKGLTFLASSGYEISLDSLACWENSLGVFNEMLSAFQNEDWVTVSDLLQYEISPMLKDGRKGLETIVQSLSKLDDGS